MTLGIGQSERVGKKVIDPRIGGACGSARQYVIAAVIHRHYGLAFQASGDIGQMQRVGQGHDRIAARMNDLERRHAMRVLWEP